LLLALGLVQHAVLAPVALAPPHVERPAPVEPEVRGRLDRSYVRGDVVAVEGVEAVPAQPVAGRPSLLTPSRRQAHAAVVAIVDPRRGRLEPLLYEVRLGLAVAHQHEMLGHHHGVRLTCAKGEAAGATVRTTANVAVAPFIDHVLLRST